MAALYEGKKLLKVWWRSCVWTQSHWEKNSPSWSWIISCRGLKEAGIKADAGRRWWQFSVQLRVRERHWCRLTSVKKKCLIVGVGNMEESPLSQHIDRVNWWKSSWEPANRWTSRSEKSVLAYPANETQNPILPSSLTETHPEILKGCQKWYKQQGRNSHHPPLSDETECH